MSAFSALLAVGFAIDGDETNMAASLHDCGVSVEDCRRLIDKLRQAEDMRQTLLGDARTDAYDDGYYVGYAKGVDDR